MRVKLYEVIQYWSKSLLRAVKEMLVRPASIGFKMGKIVFSLPNPSQIPDIFRDMVKDIMYFVFGFMVIYIQFKAILAIVMLFDFMFGTGLAKYANAVLKELIHFCYTSFMDGVKLMYRTGSYIFFGSDPIKKTETTADILCSDKRMWYVMRGFIDQVTQLLQPLWADFRNDEGVKLFSDKVENWWSDASAIWEKLRQMAGLVVEVVKKGAQFAAKAFVNVSRTIASCAKKYLPKPDIDMAAFADQIEANK